MRSNELMIRDSEGQVTGKVKMCEEIGKNDIL